MSGWAGQERRFALWAEAEGIALDYAINADLEDDAGRARRLRRVHQRRPRRVLDMGHARRRRSRSSPAAATCAFLSGNTCYWQVRLEGRRRWSCYKHRFVEDPVHATDDTHLTTTMWSDPLTGRPETTMTGVSFTRGGYHAHGRSVPAAAAATRSTGPITGCSTGTRLRPRRPARRGRRDRRLRVRRLRPRRSSTGCPSPPGRRDADRLRGGGDCAGHAVRPAHHTLAAGARRRLRAGVPRRRLLGDDSPDELRAPAPRPRRAWAPIRAAGTSRVRSGAPSGPTGSAIPSSRR